MNSAAGRVEPPVWPRGRTERLKAPSIELSANIPDETRRLDCCAAPKIDRSAPQPLPGGVEYRNLTRPVKQLRRLSSGNFGQHLVDLFRHLIDGFHAVDPAQESL